MERSEQEVKQEAKWRLEAEAEYRDQQSPLTRFRGWLVKHVVAVTLGAAIGVVVGAGWDYFNKRTENRETRSAVLFESLHRINQFSNLYGRLDDLNDPSEAKSLLSRHETYLSAPLAPSPFGIDPELKELPDMLLVNHFRRAGGDETTVAKLKDILKTERRELGIYYDGIGYASEATLVKKCGAALKRLIEAEDMLFQHPDLKRVLPLTHEELEKLRD